MASFARDVRFVHSRQDGFFSPGILFRKVVLWPFHYAECTRIANDNLSIYEKGPYGLGHVFDNMAQALEGTYLRPGKLSQVIEGGGKRRLFAIGNYIKQRLLHPIHTWAMKIFSSIPMDGTYNQDRPIQLLAKKEKRKNNYFTLNIFSYDLKSATDRFPLSFIYERFQSFFGPTMASSVVSSTLGLNSFDISSLLNRIPGKKRGPVLVSFTRGQPLGYYSSWALFSLSHHFLVWLAAEVALQSDSRFEWYALLGDDIVIANKKVAEEYCRMLDIMGVAISKEKSFLSNNGSLEFAKRFFTKGLSKDLSPVSAKAVLTIRTTLGLCQLAEKYKIF